MKASRSSATGKRSTGNAGRNTRNATKTRQSSSSRSATMGNELHKVLGETLKDIYWAEKYLAKGLTKMARAASHEELKSAFEKHKEETMQQITLLEEAFQELDMRAQGKKCEAMEGLLAEGEEQIEEYEKGPGRDAALIVAAQKIEHYEIASYGSMRSFAEVLGLSSCEEIFGAILAQETETDEKLSELAMTINREAVEAEEE